MNNLQMEKQMFSLKLAVCLNIVNNSLCNNKQRFIILYINWRTIHQCTSSVHYSKLLQSFTSINQIHSYNIRNNCNIYSNFIN